MMVLLMVAIVFVAMMLLLNVKECVDDDVIKTLGLNADGTSDVDNE